MDGVRPRERRGGRGPAREGRSPEPGRGRAGVHGVGESQGVHPPAQPEHAGIRGAGRAAPRGERRGEGHRGVPAGRAPVRDRLRVPGQRLHQPGQAPLLHGGGRGDQPRALRAGRGRPGPALVDRAMGPRGGGRALRSREDRRPGGTRSPGGQRPGGGPLRPRRGRHPGRPGLARARAAGRDLRRVEPGRPRRRSRVLAGAVRVPGGAAAGEAAWWRSSTAWPGSRATTSRSTTGTGWAGSRSFPATTTRSSRAPRPWPRR